MSSVSAKRKNVTCKSIILTVVNFCYGYVRLGEAKFN